MDPRIKSDQVRSSPGVQAKQRQPFGTVDPRIKSAGDGWDEFDFKESTSYP